MIVPSSVKGPTANPVFMVLSKQMQQPTWNFNKYLVSSDGRVIHHFPSNNKPNSE